MTNSFSRVPALRNEQIDKYAKQARIFYKQDKSSFFDVIACLKSGGVQTLKGIKQLDYVVKSDGSLGTDDALTRHEADLVTIETTERTHGAALFGEGRARFTLTHELGHAVLHDGVAMPRSSLRLVKPAWMETYRSAEHQANRFSASTLVDRAFLLPDMSIEEIAIEFGVSHLVARSFHDEIDRSAHKFDAAVRVRRIAASLSQPSAPTDVKAFLDQQCPQCGLYKMFPIAGKYMCDSCDVVFNALQDGDSA